ncbi:DEAD/DEAH box helicase [Nocardia aurantia]|uniref:ATP-dependent RNA helicase RhlE n=1 Tax=Nocardia aurantia TaxID=2585199 RepID=A0A7K0DTD7_9NOCA|nr:DEAD/DEAH box helicase [Nocardia aurantia]MQY28797.1 ATP-dependent RNA helicase RhlE [Nocardia aurantia]
MDSDSPSFAVLGVRAPLVRALERTGITAPFPIQSDTLPDSLAGRDLLGRGRTGSGKTLAFSIPMIDRLADAGRAAPNRPIGLVLAPTRELAVQIATALEPLAEEFGMTVATIFGGVPQSRQVRALRRGVDIVVACPGRLEDLIGQRLVSLDDVAITVIDEADHMADLGFLPAVTRILTATPAGGQRLLFSATLDKSVNRLVTRFLPNAVRHSAGEADVPVATMTHHVLETADATSKKVLVQRLASGSGRRILFTRTKHQARKLAKQLTAAGIPAVDLHGNLAQNARDRNLAMFSAGTARVLVATDVAARGVHVENVELVVHVDPPAEHKAYLHRSGRTARAGGTGDVVTLMLPAERGDVTALLRKAGIDAAPQRVPVDSPVVTRLVGEVAPLVAAAPVAAEPAAPGRSRQNGSGGGAGSRSNGARRRPETDGPTGRRRTEGNGAGQRRIEDGGGSGTRRHTEGSNGRRRTEGTGVTSRRHTEGNGSTGRPRTEGGTSAGRPRTEGGNSTGRRSARGHGVVPAGSTGGRAGFSRTGNKARSR